MKLRQKLLRWQDLLMGETNFRVSREYSWTYGGVGPQALSKHHWMVWT